MILHFLIMRLQQVLFLFAERWICLLEGLQDKLQLGVVQILDGAHQPKKNMEEPRDKVGEFLFHTMTAFFNFLLAAFLYFPLSWLWSLVL